MSTFSIFINQYLLYSLLNTGKKNWGNIYSYILEVFVYNLAV